MSHTTPTNTATSDLSRLWSPPPRHSHSHSLPPPPPAPPPNPKPSHLTPRRPLLLSTAAAAALTLPLSAAATPPPLEPEVTDRVFLDFTLCPTSFIPERATQTATGAGGDILLSCPDAEPLGRIVLGLYGRLLPLTVANFKAMCTGAAGSSYRGSLVHKIFPGNFFLAGRQGRRDRGEVPPPTNLPLNTETVDSKAFALTHSRPGLVSLCLSENDDDDEIKLRTNYHNVEFLITTGPGPCPRLDDKNIVFGTVVAGLDVVLNIASIPTYMPADRIRQFNNLAAFFGDERAQVARGLWNRPLKTVYISECGELGVVAKPSFQPSLP